jgi:hypothetical protein
MLGARGQTLPVLRVRQADSSRAWGETGWCGRVPVPIARERGTRHAGLRVATPPRRAALLPRTIRLPRARLAAQRPERSRDAATGVATRKNESHDSGEDRTTSDGNADGRLLMERRVGTTVDPMNERGEVRVRRRLVARPYDVLETQLLSTWRGASHRGAAPEHRGIDRLPCPRRRVYS